MNSTLVFLAGIVALTCGQTCTTPTDGKCWANTNGLLCNSPDAYCCIGGPATAPAGSRVACVLQQGQQTPSCCIVSNTPSDNTPAPATNAPPATQGPATAAPPSTCVDADPTNCPLAASEGACSQSFYYTNCQKSCNPACAGGSPPAPPANCVDANAAECQQAKNMGACTGSQASWYQQQCPLSCGACPSGGNGPAPAPAPVPVPAPSNSCVDQDPTNCPIAAQEGACSGASASFYRAQCSKSCGAC